MNTKAGPKPKPEAVIAGHSHTEAFCLMLYECEYCGFWEILYNTRDGATPFVISCRICGKEQSHAAFFLDKFISYFKPYKGMRVFVDLTKEKAIEMHKKNYNKIISGEGHYKEGFIKRFSTPEEYIEMRLKCLNKGEPTTEIIT